MAGKETGQSNIRQYYTEATDYGLDGLLGGNCHFGYSSLGTNEKFNLGVAHKAMQRLMGEELSLPTGARVLDAGCGFGPVCRTLSSEFGLRVSGIDLMHERLIAAKALNLESGLEAEISLGEADYHHLPYPNNTFDGVFTLETMVHANPLERALAEFQRVLKPGGKLILFEYSIPPLDSLNRVTRYIAGLVIARTAMSSLHRFIHGAMPSLLEKAGFENVNVRDISQHVYPTWKYLWLKALIRTSQEIMQAEFKLSNIQGSTMIYPARKRLRYNVCTTQKPLEYS